MFVNLWNFINLCYHINLFYHVILDHVNFDHVYLFTCTNTYILIYFVFTFKSIQNI